VNGAFSANPFFTTYFFQLPHSVELISVPTGRFVVAHDLHFIPNLW